uniref:Uncharacterized protein n=1 Tax=Timema douglasi TaxID=61478 RepID=A0A7R8VTY5_TIMDO|nr:unnamed protein product [Timema douglasi]
MLSNRWPVLTEIVALTMKAVLFSVLFIAGLVTLCCAHHCNSVCAATLCLRITSEDCAKEGGVFNPSNPHLEVNPCICCDSCTINRKPALREQQCSLYLTVPPSSPPPSYVRTRTTVKHHVAGTVNRTSCETGRGGQIAADASRQAEIAATGRVDG